MAETFHPGSRIRSSMNLDTLTNWCLDGADSEMEARNRAVRIRRALNTLEVAERRQNRKQIRLQQLWQDIGGPVAL